MHQVDILDLEDRRLSRQPVLGDGGEAEAERECTAPKVKSACRRMWSRVRTERRGSNI